MALFYYKHQEEKNLWSAGKKSSIIKDGEKIKFIDYCIVCCPGTWCNEHY